jgi:hypothetical protein
MTQNTDWWQKDSSEDHRREPRNHPSAQQFRHFRSPGAPAPVSTARSRALVVTGAGGALTLFSFIALPHFSLPFVGGVRMPSLIALGAVFEPALAALWLVALAAAFVAVCGLRLGLTPVADVRLRLRLVTAVQVVSILVGFAYVLFPIVLGDGSALATGLTTELLGVGYYAAVLGMVVAFIGATAAARELRLRVRTARW